MVPKKIEILPFGFRISFKLKTNDYNKKKLRANLLELKKVIIAASGPITNFFIILLMLFIKDNSYEKQILIYSNLIIFLFNLLPIYPLDGGRLLQGIVHIFFGGKISKKITNIVANIAIIIITIIGSVAVFYFKNIAIFLIIMFLWLIVIQENKKYKMIIKAYNIIRGGAVHE